MARYRAVDVRVYDDEKVRALSAPQPNAQTLWLRLLTGPETTAIPGVVRTGEAALAEALRWPLDAFRAAWAEIEAAGMAAADWPARLVWLPNGVRYAAQRNEPANPNVVKGWRATWDEVPECALKAEAWARLEAALSGRDEERARDDRENGRQERPATFGPTFRKACPRPSSKRSKGSGNGFDDGTRNQEAGNRKQEMSVRRAHARAGDEGMGSGAAEGDLPPPPEAAPGSVSTATAAADSGAGPDDWKGARSGRSPACVGTPPGGPPTPAGAAEGDAPRRPGLQVLDLVELGPLGAVFRAEAESELAHGLVLGDVDRQQLESDLETVGSVERALKFCLATARTNHADPVSVNYLATILRSAIASQLLAREAA